MSLFRKTEKTDDNVAKKSVKKVDAIVTGVLLGGVIASLYGVKKIRENHADKHETLSLPEVPPKKKSILKRIIFGNK